MEKSDSIKIFSQCPNIRVRSVAKFDSARRNNGEKELYSELLEIENKHYDTFKIFLISMTSQVRTPVILIEAAYMMATLRTETLVVIMEKYCRRQKIKGVVISDKEFKEFNLAQRILTLMAAKRNTHIFDQILPAAGFVDTLFSRRITPTIAKVPSTYEKVNDVYVASIEKNAELMTMLDYYNVSYVLDVYNYSRMCNRTNVAYDERNLNRSRVLLFFVTQFTPCLSNMVLASYYIGERPESVVLCMKHLDRSHGLKEEGLCDYNKGRITLTHIAKINGVPIYGELKEAVECAIEKLRSQNY